MSYRKHLLVLLSALMLLGCAAPKRETNLSFTGLETDPRHFSGRLTLPEGAQTPLPVVMIVHGSAGVDSRYGFHRPALLAAGMATFEVDFKTHVFTTRSNRPPVATFQPWVFGALRALHNHPAIDPKPTTAGGGRWPFYNGHSVCNGGYTPGRAILQIRFNPRQEFQA